MVSQRDTIPLSSTKIDTVMGVGSLFQIKGSNRRNSQGLYDYRAGPGKQNSGFGGIGLIRRRSR
jgi:hypothetical protein